jgi:hypothetical protein
MLYGVTGTCQIRDLRVRARGTLTSLGVRQSHGDTFGHTDLIQLQIGITSDDRTRRKVDSLPHEITSQSPFLALQPRPDRFDRSPGLLHVLRDTRDLVVHVRRDVELEQGELFLDDRRWDTLILHPPHVSTHLEDLSELVGQIIL